jgi:hypothetical protein
MRPKSTIFCDLFSSPPIIPFNYDLCTFKLTFCQLVLHRSNKQSAKLPFQVSHWLITTPLHMLSWLQRSWPPSQWLALQLSSGRVSKARRSRSVLLEVCNCLFDMFEICIYQAFLRDAFYHRFNLSFGICRWNIIHARFSL